MRQGIGQAAQKAAYLRQFNRALAKLISYSDKLERWEEVAEYYFNTSKYTAEAAASKYAQHLQTCNDINTTEESL